MHGLKNKLTVDYLNFEKLSLHVHVVLIKWLFFIRANYQLLCMLTKNQISVNKKVFARGLKDYTLCHI